MSTIPPRPRKKLHGRLKRAIKAGVSTGKLIHALAPLIQKTRAEELIAKARKEVEAEKAAETEKAAEGKTEE